LAVFVLGVEGEPFLGSELVDGDYVPGFFGDDVDGQDVDFGGGVGGFGVAGLEVAGADEVSAFAEAVGGFGPLIRADCADSEEEKRPRIFTDRHGSSLPLL
jgi:hypothetical protein